MLRPALVICILGACGSSRVPSAKAPAAAGGACPGPDRVVVLRWMESDDEGTKLAPGWRAFLTNKALERNDEAASYVTGPLAADAPRTIWVEAVGRAPCRATVTGSFRQITNVGPMSEQTGVELSGCPTSVETASDFAFGLIGDDAGACELTYATGVAARRLDMSSPDGEWKLEPDVTPIPSALAPLVDHRACDAPCVALWYAGGAGDDAYDVIQTWLKGAAGDACSLEHDDAFRVLVRTGGNLVPLADGDVGNQQLTGVFRDPGGARMVVLEDVGEYSIFTLSAPPALARHVVWFDKNEEDANWRSLAPYCGP